MEEEGKKTVVSQQYKHYFWALHAHTRAASSHTREQRI